MMLYNICLGLSGLKLFISYNVCLIQHFELLNKALCKYLLLLLYSASYISIAIILNCLSSPEKRLFLNRVQTTLKM